MAEKQRQKEDLEIRKLRSDLPINPNVSWTVGCKRNAQSDMPYLTTVLWSSPLLNWRSCAEARNLSESPQRRASLSDGEWITHHHAVNHGSGQNPGHGELHEPAT